MWSGTRLWTGTQRFLVALLAVIARPPPPHLLDYVSQNIPQQKCLGFIFESEKSHTPWKCHGHATTSRSAPCGWTSGHTTVTKRPPIQQFSRQLPAFRTPKGRKGKRTAETLNIGTIPRRGSRILIRRAQRSFEPRGAGLSPKFTQNRGFSLKIA